MRILHIINALEVGGAERLLMDALPMMKAKGHDVEVLLLQSTGDVFEEQLKKEGIRVSAINAKGGRYSPLNILRLMKMMKGYDVIHSHLFPSQYWAALAKKIVNAKNVLVTTEHSTFNTRARHGWSSWIDKKIYGLYDGVICISEATAKFMRERCPKNVQISVIENGILLPSEKDLKAKKSRRELLGNLPDDVFLLLQVARFTEQKDQACVIRALKRLPENVHVAFAGYGVTQNENEALAHQLGVEHRTHFLGMRSDVADLWNVADLGIMSSNWEGFGLAAVEGMARHRAVLASNVKGLAEVVGFPELLFPKGDDTKLAHSIQHFMSSPDELKAIGEKCAKRAKHYSIEHMVEKYLDFYSGLELKRL